MHTEITLTLAGQATPQAMAPLVEALDQHRIVPAPHNLDHDAAVAWLRARRDDLGRCVVVVSSDTHGITLPAVTPDSIHNGIVAAGLDATWRSHTWGPWDSSPWTLLEIHLATGEREIYWDTGEETPYEPSTLSHSPAERARRAHVWTQRARIHSAPLLLGDTAHGLLSDRALFGTPPALYRR